MTVFRRIDSGFAVVEKLLTIIAWFVLLAVMVMIVADIALRAVFDHPLPASWEISEVLMPFMIFLPFAYTLTLGAHIRVTLVTSRLSQKGQLACSVFCYAISFIMTSMLTYWSFLRFLDSYKINEVILAAINIPWWPGKAIMPIGMALLAIRYLFLLIKAVWFKDIDTPDTGGLEPVPDTFGPNVIAAG